MIVGFAGNVKAGEAYNRHPPRESLISVNDDVDPITPQQVHISLVGEDKMRISWITEDHTPATVHYGTSPGKYEYSTNGTVSSYKYNNYTSGEIHEVVIGPLTGHSTTYYYWFGGSSPEYSFKTPPVHLPIKFVLVGDLGQTDVTQSTLEHIAQSNYDVLISPGDLSCADTEQTYWDSFGRLVEPLASKRRGW
ncbi:hypothetical protein L1987_86838 [Smallanthus sonchifolius]|uniref:Uncharacterized protein n=1 Tax=Smallanthus sonchifolius TaxID=185202 RepID=A0ACB8Y1P2_9ASTR|nr:hypothetical protein L1987_86838 [Smallanthus sonchifolius]